MSLKKKDLLGIKDMDAEEIGEILETAKSMKKLLLAGTKRTPHLQGKTVVTLFYENSTRTRLSFELASKYMGANAANITASGSSVAKGETLIDTGRTIDVMGTDVLVIRHPLSGAPHLLAQHVRASVVNAGDGMDEHPTQALLDLFTMREKKGRIEGLRVAIVGDVLHSRVARSNIWALQKLGASVCLAGPTTMMPREIERTGAAVFETAHEAVAGADVVMALRLQLERQKSGLFPSIREYSRFFGVDTGRLRLAKPDVLLMHPGPVNRGVELTSAVADADFSAIDEQVTNGVAVRMAILYLLARREN
ncbi:MAG: aspartate carbamoyltransferase catalytic subunit [Clostridiales bacterium]|jgi:aspartate carbamoyltransferase catalytic subunit|nr:aspartate carbamoyltransferase catalytic subunit [Clostridiales bacterium]